MNSVIFIIGVAGSGKTTIGKKLSAQINIPFLDGDDFHSLKNKEKMKAGIPLNDQDRKDWLLSINKAARELEQKSGAIIACSALKEKYRQLLTTDVKKIRWIYLEGKFEMIKKRMLNRVEHFMPVSLLQSQFEILEPPISALKISIENSPDYIIKEILEYIK